MRQKEDHIYVVGHKNPDTDSVCAALSLAYLKNVRSGTSRYMACRAGQINSETEFVLNYWNVESPYYMPNVGMQVSDMEIDESEGAPDDITIRIAWEYMKESNTVTLPVMAEDGSLEGLLTVGDIANYYIDAYTKTIMAEAKTKYYDIAETINGTVLVGNEHSYFANGKVMVGAAKPERLAELVERDDLVILSDREDTQQKAIEGGASCIVVCLTDNVSEEIKQLAEEHMCVIICTRFDTYTVARLINQSIPARVLMKSKDLVTFNTEDFVDDIREAMGKYRYRDFPVLDHHGRYIGMVNRRSLINIQKKRVILVDHTEESQAVDNLNQAEILEIVDHHRIGTVETLQPVYFRGEPVGCTCTILASMFEEQRVEIPKEIAGLMCSAILSDTLMFRSPTCTARDEAMARKLAEIAGIEIEVYAKAMFKAGSDLKGKTPQEILHQDYKKFVYGETEFTVGQISSMDQDELYEIAKTLLPVLEEECGQNGISMAFFMLTNILTEDTTLLCVGENSDLLVQESFGATVENNMATLPKVVSRKKQLIPAFMTALQTMG